MKSSAYQDLIVKHDKSEKMKKVDSPIFKEEVTITNLEEGDKLEIITEKGVVQKIYEHQGKLYECC